MENEVETWKDVVDYEGLYEVSSFGRVRSLNYNHTGKIQVLKPSYDLGGYVQFILYKEGICKTFKSHVLVVTAFLDRDYRKKDLVVNHKNFKRDDNRLLNLEVVTIRENANKKHLKSSSKYTGVSWNKIACKWTSYILFNKKTDFLGNFDNEEDASIAYQKALKAINDGCYDINLLRKPFIRTSKYTGVHFCKTRKKWCASVKVNKKTKNLGRFKTEYEAFVAIELYKKNK